MSTTSTTDRTAFDRVTTVIGHLDHPLYDDEHHRDVWNEASAVGYQAFVWATTVFLAVASWVGGPGSAPFVLVPAVILGVAGTLTMVHAQRRGVDPWRTPGTGWARWTVATLLGLVMIGGLAANSRLGFDVPTVVGASIGGVVGAGAALVLMLAAIRLARRRVPRGED